jgi:hypothetical protein
MYVRSLTAMYALGFFSFLVGVSVFVRVISDQMSGKPPALTFGDLGALLLAAALTIGGATSFVRAIIHSQSPHGHPLLRNLAAFGPPLQVARAIDAELSRVDEVVTIGEPLRSFRLNNHPHHPVQVTRSWVVQQTLDRVQVVRLDEIVWVEKGDHRRVRVDVYSPLVAVRTRRGDELLFFLAEGGVQRLLLELLSRLPWVLSGFDPGREQQWQTDRPRVVQSVEQAREQIQALSPEARRALVDDKVQRAAETKEPRP